MNRNFLIISVTVLIIGFISGYFYGKSQNSFKPNGVVNKQAMQFTGQRMGVRSGSMISGEIIAKDDTSLTLKLRDGGSKIVFLLASTSVSKMSPVSVGEINIGANISVSGNTNKDGSLNATSIQEMPIFPVK